MIVSLPGRYRATFDLSTTDPKGQMTVVLNGDRGWRHQCRRRRGAWKRGIGRLQQDAYAMWAGSLVPLREKEFDLSPLPEIQINGQPALGVKVAQKGHNDLKLYFDPRSSLLTKIERRGREAGLIVTKEHLFLNHKDVERLQMASREIQLSNGKKLVEINLKAAKFLPKVDESAFAKP